MTNQTISIAVVLLVGVMGCKEEMVGAPCVPETDDGSFNVDLTGETWSIETGSVQCATRICLTQITDHPEVTGSRKDLCKADPTTENCWTKEDDDGDAVEGPVQMKFSFCSCRCRDGEGNTVQDNPDKYEDVLCECPPTTVCQDVMEPLDDESVSDRLPGGYCVPQCIANPCLDEDGTGPKICSPSKNSDEPWKWYCDEIPGGK